MDEPPGKLEIVGAAAIRGVLVGLGVRDGKGLLVGEGVQVGSIRLRGVGEGRLEVWVGVIVGAVVKSEAKRVLGRQL